MDTVNSSKMGKSAVVSQFTESSHKGQDEGLLHNRWSEALLDLICAAAINSRFCQTLLFEPDKAIDSGFNGQQFEVTPQERLLVRSIYATSLPDFVQQIDDKITSR